MNQPRAKLVLGPPHGKMCSRLLTFLGLTLSDHEGADLRVRELQQLLSLVSAQPFKQPAGDEKDSYEYPECTLPTRRQEGCRNGTGPANIKPAVGIEKKSKVINGSSFISSFNLSNSS